MPSITATDTLRHHRSTLLIDVVREPTGQRQAAMIDGDCVSFGRTGAVGRVHVERRYDWTGQLRRQVSTTECPGCHERLDASTDFGARMRMAEHERVCVELQLWFTFGEPDDPGAVGYFEQLAGDSVWQ